MYASSESSGETADVQARLSLDFLSMQKVSKSPELDQRDYNSTRVNHFILDTDKQVHCQPVKTHMKCRFAAF